jgi:hypothetical protein
MTTGLSISGHSKRYYKNGQIQIHNKSNICGNQDYIGRNIHHEDLQFVTILTDDQVQLNLSFSQFSHKSFFLPALFPS